MKNNKEFMQQIKKDGEELMQWKKGCNEQEEIRQKALAEKIVESLTVPSYEDFKNRLLGKVRECGIDDSVINILCSIDEFSDIGRYSILADIDPTTLICDLIDEMNPIIKDLCALYMNSYAVYDDADMLDSLDKLTEKYWKSFKEEWKNRRNDK